MLRSSRTVVSLVRSLVLGTATTTTATVMVASMLVVGCKDESQPAFWVEKLEGPLHSVLVAHSRLIKPAELKAIAGEFRLH